MAGAEHRGASSGDRRGRAPQHGGGRQRKPERIPCELARPVFFVGFMGAGKTSVSRRLARLCGIASIDMDSYIERREGRRIRDIFAEDGEGRFRDLETQVLREMTQGDPALVSCGGGVVLAQYIGRGEEENARRSVGQLTLLLVGFSMMISVLFMLFRDELLVLLFGQIEPQVMAYARTYFL